MYFLNVRELQCAAGSPVARAQFRVIAEDERFVGLPQIIDAQIMIAEVDRLSGRFKRLKKSFPT